MEIPWIVDPTFLVFSLYMEALISYGINPVRVNVITKQRSCFPFESEPNLKKGTFGFQIGVVNKKKKFSPLIMAAATVGNSQVGHFENTVLSKVKLRCSGVQPNDNHVKSELDRVDLYQDKLERLLDLNKAPLRPSTMLNSQAATRFIEHSLPDLTPEQRQRMRNLSSGEGKKRKHQEQAGQKRKYQSSEKPSISVQAAAQEFLEKAQRELFGGNNGGIKGPLQIDNMSESDDDQIDNLSEDDGDKLPMT